MNTLTCSASGVTGSLKGFGNNNATKTVYYSGFSPVPKTALEGKTMVQAFFSYHAYCGDPNNTTTYNGDCNLKFYENSTNYKQIISNSSGSGHQIGYNGYNGSSNVTDYMDASGVFNSITATFYKSILTASSREYKYGLTNIKITYYYLPYVVTWSGINGTVTMSVANRDENKLTFTATPNTGYHFVKWADGVTTQTRTDEITGDYDFIAEFAPNHYSVNFYDITSGERVLIQNLPDCEYGETYTAPSLPIYTVEGHEISQWFKGEDTTGAVQYGTNALYHTSNLSQEITTYKTITNATSTDGGVVNYFCKLFPCRYTVTYRPYVENSFTYTPATDYRVYGQGDFFLKELSDATPGYKLTNKMSVENGPINSEITSFWFTSDSAVRPGDPMINYIPSDFTSNSDLYSYEVPINYTTFFEIYDYDGTLIKTDFVDCLYMTPFFAKTYEDLQGRVLIGWFEDPQDISQWYIDINSFTSVVNGIQPNKTLDYEFNNLTEEDFGKKYFYGYYVPKSYLLEYSWIDQWGQGLFPVPSAKMRIFGRTNLQVDLIPEYENYNIDNVNTYHWYIDNNKTNINNWEYIPLDVDENLHFYAFKTPIGEQITFSVNDTDWGEVIVENPLPDEIYPENYIITVYAKPLDNKWGYFSHWSDGNNNPFRFLSAPNQATEYKAYFRSRQIFATKPEINFDEEVIE